MQRFKWAHIITYAATVLSLLSTIVYCTWFVSSIEKRVSIVEDDMRTVFDRLKEFHERMDSENLTQDYLLHRFEDKIENKVEFLYRNQIDVSLDGVYECKPTTKKKV